MSITNALRTAAGVLIEKAAGLQRQAAELSKEATKLERENTPHIELMELTDDTLLWASAPSGKPAQGVVESGEEFYIAVFDGVLGGYSGFSFKSFEEAKAFAIANKPPISNEYSVSKRQNGQWEPVDE